MESFINHVMSNKHFNRELAVCTAVNDWCCHVIIWIWCSIYTSVCVPGQCFWDLWKRFWNLLFPKGPPLLITKLNLFTLQLIVVPSIQSYLPTYVTLEKRRDNSWDLCAAHSKTIAKIDNRKSYLPYCCLSWNFFPCRCCFVQRRVGQD